MSKTTNSPLRIRAGKEAYSLIQKEGLSPDMIRCVASAAGGPKWFTVFGLTKYIIADLIPADQKCHFIGASAGAWQMTAALCPDPAASIDQLRQGYAEYIYSEKPGPAEISGACREFTTEMVQDNLDHILDHPHRSLHIVTAHGSRGLNSKNPVVLGGSLAMVYLGNMVSRRYNHPFVNRIIWNNDSSLPYNAGGDVLPTITKNLSKDNIYDILQATGAIPFMMERVSDIAGGPGGSYWDGGITDYQISLPYEFDEPGIVLHPHFSPDVLAGWMDKKLPWKRPATQENMSKVLLLYPSDDYIQSLPKQRISDMKDFYEFGDDQEARIKYWREIAARSEELAESLHEMIETGRIMEYIEPY